MVSNSWPLLFAAFCCAGMTYGAYHLPKENVVTEHHVEVIRQLPSGDWAMRSDEEASLVFRTCPDDARNGVDTDGILKAGVGWIADHAKWEERGTCKSILRPDLGFWWPDEKFQYRRAGQ